MKNVGARPGSGRVYVRLMTVALVWDCGVHVGAATAAALPLQLQHNPA